jgi:TATA-box binding protein (TBP) (component of TFIID and TFIIIB)
MATQPNISTMTYTAKITDKPINIYKFYDICEIQNNGVGIKRVEYLDSTDTHHLKGEPRKQKRKVSKQRFENQITVIFQPYEDLLHYKINIKIFKNGVIQMTGVKNEKDAEKTINYIAAKLKIMQHENDDIVSLDTIISVSDLRIRLINSDFQVPFKINNYKLQSWIIQNTELVCIYEPCIYPGVKLLYYWNNEFKHNGICKCKKPCAGKGNSCGDGQCKKITISVFQSGSIIITGAVEMIQLSTVHKFIETMLFKAKNDIEHIPVPSYFIKLATKSATTSNTKEKNILKFFTT